MYGGRISPLFDTARRLLLVDIENGREVRRNEQVVEELELGVQVRRTAGLRADVLICGAISRPLEALLSTAGVAVISQASGLAEDVLRAFASGQLTEQSFLMPGCRERRTRYRGARSTEKKMPSAKTNEEEGDDDATR